MADRVVRPSWTARVLIYKGSDSLEEIMFDSYEATSEANARALAVELGFGYLKTLGFTNKEEAGCRIIAVVPDKPVGAAPNPSYNRSGGNYYPQDNRGHVRQVPVVVPFKCPIVKLCTMQYVGVSVGSSFNVEHMPIVEAKEDG